MFKYAALILISVVLLAFPAQALQRSPIPNPECDSCLCERSRCYDEVGRLYDRCLLRANTTWEFFGCENSRDADYFYCEFEMTACLISPFR